MAGITLDAGARAAVERNDRYAISLLAVVRRERELVTIPAGVLGQVWRDGHERCD